MGKKTPVSSGVPIRGFLVARAMLTLHRKQLRRVSCKQERVSRHF
jgi:hypothetical protein